MNVLEGLNPQQKEAVEHYEGPLLILAGAGSGKTRVLTNRIAWLIDEKDVSPWNILAITFTNKAAQEMRQRVDSLVGYGAESIWVATFHSTCGRILRRHIDRLGYDPHFTIYDTDDQKSLIKELCKQMNIDTQMLKEKRIMNAISAAKNELIGPEQFAAEAAGDYPGSRIADVYRAYQSELKKRSAVDFDDMLMLTVELFDKNEDILEMYRDRFRFIMVDEYQDTNTAQFRLISQLAGKRGNLCVVGDDDQSIYSFRGANINNILNFEKIWPQTKVIRLEQNYRSTGNILEAANHVIANNRSRKKKTLWTENSTGSSIHVREFDTAFHEADFVAGEIASRVRKGGAAYSDFAILYRTNAQSRLLEEKLLMRGIPYRLIGGVNFYARREIKDLLSYMRAISNPDDDLAVQRIINIPKRGIGATTINRVAEYARVNDLTFYEALTRGSEIPGLGRAAVKTDAFVTTLAALRGKAEFVGVRKLLEEIIEQTGYVRELEKEGTDEAKERIENINELITKAEVFEENASDPSLTAFLEEVSLVADIDEMDDSEKRVVLMTLHSAKGLEFPVVFLTGLEEDIFPSAMSMMEDDSGKAVEEERRLCYVGITRAMQDLTMTWARTRMLRGETRYHEKSRFLDELPGKVVDASPEKKKTASPAPSKPGSGRFGFDARFDVPKRSASPRPVKAASLDYQEGDRVTHIKFGAGTVTQITDGGKDYEVTVDFDKYGTKKLFAGFAKLKKV